MKTKIPFLLGALVLAAPLGLFLAADDRPPPSSTGRVLLLENERTLEGDIERTGDQYRVRRAIGETWVPAQKVLLMCGSHREALAFLRARADLRDPDERLRLAQWCQLHDLRDQALVEVTAAVKLRPEHAPSQRLLANLQRSISPPAAPSGPPAGSGEPAQAAGLNVEVNQEALGQFATRVQPILFNTCASCHATGRGGNFKLVRPLTGEMGGRRTLQQNLSAVLAQVNMEQPQVSPFLVKAVSVHGEMSQPPLQGRQLAAYKTLEDWVRTTLAGNPQLRVTTRATPAGPAAKPPSTASDPPAAETAASPPERPAAQPDEPDSGPFAETTPEKEEGVPGDVYDPTPFNRQGKPGQQPPRTPK